MHLLLIFRVRLIASVPGRHTGLNKTKWGHLKLRKARLFALLTIREATSLEKIVEKIIKRMSQSKAFQMNRTIISLPLPPLKLIFLVN